MAEQASRARWKLSSGLVAWAIAGLLANLPLATDHAEYAQIAVGFVGIAHCVIGFWRDGGARITAPGVYLLSSGLFVFYPAIYLAIQPTATLTGPHTLLAVNLAYWSQVALFHFFWEPRTIRSVSVTFIQGPEVTRWGATWGVALILLGAIGAQLHWDDSAIWTDAAAYTGTVILAVALLRREGFSLVPYIIVGAALLAYVEFIFTGFGRLRIGALGIALVLVVATRRNHLAKAALLASFPPVLAYLAADRIQFTAGINPNQSPDVTGLESVISPFLRFAQILQIESAGELPNSWGASFFAAFTALIPRQLWPEKPVGFGAELAQFFRPELVGTGHSEAALLFGEWVWGFGFAGIILMIPVIGMFIRVIDNTLLASSASALATRRNLLHVAMLIILVASIVDLFWVGSFTYVARVGPRLIIVGIIFVLGGWSTRSANGVYPLGAIPQDAGLSRDPFRASKRPPMNNGHHRPPHDLTRSDTRVQ